MSLDVEIRRAERAGDEALVRNLRRRRGDARIFIGDRVRHPFLGVGVGVVVEDYGGNCGYVIGLNRAGGELSFVYQVSFDSLEVLE